MHDRMFPKLISKATFKHFFVNSLQKHRQAKLFNLRETKDLKFLEKSFLRLNLNDV